MKKIFAVLLCLCMTCISFSGCNNQEAEKLNISSKTTSTIIYNYSKITSSATTIENIPEISSETDHVSNNANTLGGGYRVNWDKCIKETKESITDTQYYWFVDDVNIEINHSEKKIVLTAVVNASVNADTALEYAETMVRQFNTFAKFQDSSIDGATKDSYGGLYKEYTALVGVSSLDNISDQNKWFVNDTLYSGLDQKLELNRAYS